jgi:hypothetical protein
MCLMRMGLFQRTGDTMSGATNLPLGGRFEPVLDLIEPRGRDRREVRVETWLAGRRSPLIDDPGLSPLDVLRSLNATILVSSEYPFGAPDAVTTIREYDVFRGNLIRAFSPDKEISFRKPRGLRFGPDGNLYCVAEETVVCCDFHSGKCLGAVLHWPRLNGQALEFVP